MKNIQKLGVARFKVSTPNAVGSELELDFNPIIKEFKLSGNYTLIHWQARPKGERQWGIYSSADDRYRSVSELSQFAGFIRSLQLDDRTATTIPSAVLYSDESQITCIDDRVILGTVRLSDI